MLALPVAVDSGERNRGDSELDGNAIRSSSFCVVVFIQTFLHPRSRNTGHRKKSKLLDASSWRNSGGPQRLWKTGLAHQLSARSSLGVHGSSLLGNGESLLPTELGRKLRERDERVKKTRPTRKPTLDRRVPMKPAGQGPNPPTARKVRTRAKSRMSGEAKPPVTSTVLAG